VASPVTVLVYSHKVKGGSVGTMAPRSRVVGTYCRFKICVHAHVFSIQDCYTYSKVVVRKKFTALSYCTYPPKQVRLLCFPLSSYKKIDVCIL
jgi:hypothetical protein